MKLIEVLSREHGPGVYVSNTSSQRPDLCVYVPESGKAVWGYPSESYTRPSVSVLSIHPDLDFVHTTKFEYTGTRFQEAGYTVSEAAKFPVGTELSGGADTYVVAPDGVCSKDSGDRLSATTYRLKPTGRTLERKVTAAPRTLIPLTQVLKYPDGASFFAFGTRYTLHKGKLMRHNDVTQRMTGIENLPETLSVSSCVFTTKEVWE